MAVCETGTAAVWMQSCMYLLSLLVDLEAIVRVSAFLLEYLEAIVHVPAFSAGESGINRTCTCFSPGGSGSNRICTCFVCYRSFEYKKSVVFIVKRGRLGMGNLNNVTDRTGFQRRLPVRCGCVRRQVDMQR